MTLAAIPVTSPSRTLLDLAGVLSHDVVELALEDALRRRLASLPRIRWRLDSLCGPGVPGCRLLAQMVAARETSTSPTESGLETRIWRFLRERDLPPPARQHVVKQGGKTIARPDFAYPDRRFALEGHSYRFHSSRASWEKDHARHARLTSLGWRVIYITHGDLVYRADELEEEIRAALGLCDLSDAKRR